MSRLDDLIAELCPDGVPHQALGDVGEFVRGSGILKSDFRETGVGCIHYGQIHTHYGIWATEVIAFVDPSLASKSRHARSGDLVIATTSEDADAVGKAVAWLGTDEVAVSSDAFIYRHSLDPKYVSYFFASESFSDQKARHVSGTKVKRISGDRMASIRIPVPPLEVQREIVRILDQFTELEAELEAERRCRALELAYHKARIVKPPTGVTWTTLGDAAVNHDRLRKPVTRAAREAGPYPYYGANGVQDHVSDFLFDGTYLLVGEDGSVVRADGTPVLNWAVGKAWVNNHAHVLENRDSRFNLRYLFHFLSTVDVTPFVTGGTQPKLNQANMNRIPVPEIPRDDQDRIADILDKFDALVNDISIGLPAELAARRKQYEYYRDKLLTFTELPA